MKFLTAALAATAAMSLAASAGATDLVQNGNFASNDGNGQIGVSTSVANWSVPTGGYAFLFAPGTADTSGANGQYGFLSLWGPGNGSANGMPATSPYGGYVVALDGDFQNEPLQQTINGLTVGKTYALTFYDAFGQQSGFYGPTIQDLAVSLGGETLTTPAVDVASQGFSGWNKQTFDFTATNSSEVLSFLAYGNQPVPPFALVSGVSLSAAVPEPADWALLLIGVGGVGAMARRRAAALRLSAA
jgi:hypothetical protein